MGGIVTNRNSRVCCCGVVGVVVVHCFLYGFECSVGASVQVIGHRTEGWKGVIRKADVKVYIQSSMELSCRKRG